MKNSKLVMLRGLPASGKTTWAQSWVCEDSLNRIRTNRDDLRRMCGMVGYEKTRERYVNLLQEEMVKKALENGMSVVVDDTNFSSHREPLFRRIAEESGATFEVKEFDTPVRECLYRNARREKPVPEKVITDMWYKNYFSKQPPVAQQDTNRTSAIICDIDGTLAYNDGHRGWFEEAEVYDDEVRWEVLVAVKALQSFWGGRIPIIFMSGRSEACRDETERWLREKCQTFDTEQNDELHMRKIGDSRPDAIVKREMYDEFIRDKYLIRGVFDDRPSVCDMWRELRLPLFDVGPGIPF